MTKKLTITVDDEVYDGLHAVIGRRNISKFLSRLARPYVVKAHLKAAYEKMARDEHRERQALEWAEALVGDVEDARH